MLMELLDKYFNENPWYDLTNLDEIIKFTGLDETSIKVKVLFVYKQNKKKSNFKHEILI